MRSSRLHLVTAVGDVELPGHWKEGAPDPRLHRVAVKEPKLSYRKSKEFPMGPFKAL